ncbi:hypothetical protein [Pseudomonas phage LUZ7]|uniref:Uncharacterized protein n=1 Tax=Pseudomonas phage LUZ7 TaxID=655097 RepID=C8ZKJ1_9CAUD|nr:hypothetical protein PP-LUZ7_gp092 [Pseudomonas phage LUZ7]CAZ66233.1 hypothetical protein [Pseudomonas phage LUZ7]
MTDIWMYQIKAAIGYCYGRVMEQKHLKEFGYTESNDYTSEYTEALPTKTSVYLWKEARKHLKE